MNEEIEDRKVWASKLVELAMEGVLDINVGPGINFNKYVGIKEVNYTIQAYVNIKNYYYSSDPCSEIVSWINDQCFEGHQLSHDEYKKSEKIGTVYLMKNIRNNYIKIGFTSNDPKYRERTLQSEEPEIELIEYWKGTFQDEQNLHQLFHKKRVRGEWFKLSEKDIKRIEEYFSD